MKNENSPSSQFALEPGDDERFYDLVYRSYTDFGERTPGPDALAKETENWIKAATRSRLSFDEIERLYTDQLFESAASKKRIALTDLIARHRQTETVRATRVDWVAQNSVSPGKIPWGDKVAVETLQFLQRIKKGKGFVVCHCRHPRTGQPEPAGLRLVKDPSREPYGSEKGPVAWVCQKGVCEFFHPGDELDSLESGPQASIDERAAAFFEQPQIQSSRTEKTASPTTSPQALSFVAQSGDAEIEKWVASRVEGIKPHRWKPGVLADLVRYIIRFNPSCPWTLEDLQTQWQDYQEWVLQGRPASLPIAIKRPE